jgi:hypothetical protein
LTVSRVRTSCLAFVVAFVFEISWLCSSARAAGDPYLEWWTLETPHFRIHYYKGLEPVAEKFASIVEGVNDRLTDALGWKTTEVTDIVLQDNTDDANGFADAVPYNSVHLYVTAPDDVSALGDYDDWQLELVTHEYTHVLHTDTIGGIPALVNVITGKRWSPNRAQPRWILEGLAVLEESEHTSGGRNRSSIFDMYLRADTLEHRLAGLDQMSHFVRRWPQGNLWYLYGSRFLTWIADVYGDAALRSVSRDYGQQILPWGINRSMRRATGRTYEELYEGWAAYLAEHYGEQMRQVDALGLREGVRLTHHGESVASPRFVPPAAMKTKSAAELLYFRDDAHSRAGFYRLPLDGPKAARESDEELFIRMPSRGVASFDRDGQVVFNSVAITKRIYGFNDLFFLAPGADAQSGYEPERTRLTEGERAQEPDVSPDGSQVVFTENHRGTTTLMIARLTQKGELRDPHPLVPSARFQQAYTPRFSPDGKWVTYSVWTAGGYRDIRIVDVATGAFSEVTHDRAMDWEPTFSPDGNLVFFASDRTFGIPNIFAFDRSSKKLWQVTNVRTGALYPEVSPDGKTLVYVGYTSRGHDLYAMDLDPARFIEAAPYIDTRPETPGSLAADDAAASSSSGAIRSRHPYNPLPTLRPRSWDLNYGPGSFGTAISVTTTGGDVVGNHSIAASLLVETEHSDLQGGVSYAYGRLPFDFRVGAYRVLTPIRVADDRPLFLRQTIGVSSGIGYALPTEFEGHSFALSYSLSRFDGALPLAPAPDPYAPVRDDPPRGQIGSIHLGWSFSNVEGYLNSLGGERGFALSVTADVAAPALASDYTLYVFGYSASDYILMPWGHHHSLALHGASAFTMGNYPYQGLFYAGGFVEAPLIQNYTLGAYQGPFVLRGYPALSVAGNQYHLLNAEYRFPIVDVERGYSTFPFFIGRISGNFFADYGGAFDRLDDQHWTDQFHLGVGAELWAELTVGYFLSAQLRIGHARGIKDPLAVPGGQTYVVIAAPF